jgi:hypothetical protein
VMSAPASAGTLRYAMDLVGGNGLFVGSQTSDLDVDPARDVAYSKVASPMPQASTLSRQLNSHSRRCSFIGRQRSREPTT